MPEDSRLPGPLELEPIDEPLAAVEDVGANADGTAIVAQSDDGGDVRRVAASPPAAIPEVPPPALDRALWTQLLAKSGGDEAKAKAAYARAQETMEKLAKRDSRSRKALRRLPEDTDYPMEAASPETARVRSAHTKPTSRLPLLGAAALGLVLTGAGAWFIGAGPATADVQQPGATSVVRGTDPAAPGEAAQSSTASAAPVAGPAPAVPSESLEQKVAQLRDAGNWNVMVLIASEWTRKEPANVNAWVELSVGYSMLRQFGEALETATKATRLEPGDPRVWRNLGQVNSALGLPAEALHAFEQAIALDDQDVQSLVQTGLLNAQLARLAQAKAAFDKALIASPDDVGALCGQAAIARQQGRPKDADAIAGRLQSLGRSCRDGSESGTAALVAIHAPTQKSPSSRTR